ncbi:sulfite exporter TauE/SafE family protein [Comamonas composti]|uniref:sulfite exporter TauE/SafE family protein n=1 Tax=Comamonas composti TaxID=408558 RepID=UPI000400524B|nr:sulfite exporter TauE/SafE family protein [Comamonas composti]
MLLSLLGTALIMGLVGGPHCLAMCAAPCSIVASGGLPKEAVVTLPGQASRMWFRQALFHSGRLAGYASLGGVSAMAMESLSWLTSQTTALQPLWTLMHVLVMAWGLAMLVQARQPAWLESAGRAAWQKVQPMLKAPAGLAVAGYAWALMPCGLLYSAVLVAALSGGAVQGALVMTAFGLGSALWLISAPLLWRWSRDRMNGARAEWGTRLAGLMLVAVAVWALWMDLIYTPSLWCR